MIDQRLANGSVHRVLPLVLESLRADDLGPLCEGQSITPEELTALRHAFIRAGTAGLLAHHQPRAWHQVGVHFDSLGLQWYLFVAGDFQDRVRRWLEAGIAEQFCFLHKPPGVRIRVLGDEASLRPELSSAFNELVRDGQIGGWSRARYETEPHLFGGAAGLAIAHRFFTIDSLAVLAFHRLRLRGEASLDPGLFSLLLIDLLLRETTDDAWERWDVWCKMELTGRALALEDEAAASALQRSLQARQVVGDLLADPARTLDGLPEAERRLLAEYQSNVRPIASDLARAQDHGALRWERRTILPFWIVFHWNRMAFALYEQRWMTFLMTTLLSPRPDQATTRSHT